MLINSRMVLMVAVYASMLHVGAARTYRPMMVVQPEILVQPTHMALGITAMGALCLTALIVLRSTRTNLGGRAVIAGTLAGVLMGPGVFGRVFPDRFETWFIGGQQQRHALEFASWFKDAVSPHLGTLTPDARQSFSDEKRGELAQLEADLEQARWMHQRLLRWLIVVLASVTAMCSALMTPTLRDQRQGRATLFSIGIWSFALPAAAAYVCAVRWWEASAQEAMMLASAVGIGAWMVTASEQATADGAEFGGAWMIQWAGRVATVLSLGLLVVATRSSASNESLAGVLTLTAAVFASWLVAWRIHRGSVSSPANRRFGTESIAWALDLSLAMLAATLCLHIDVHVQLDWRMLAMIVALIVISNDGRWIGAFVGAMLLGGRPPLRTMRLVMPAMAAGASQLSIAAWAVQSHVLSMRYAMPLLLGVLMIELTSGVRSRMARRLIDAEHEFDRLSDDR